MILILGGTTEGRVAVKVADEAGNPYYYSTKSEWQKIVCKNGVRLTGGMDILSMESFCKEKEIKLIIDAAHPFAIVLHHTVAKVAERLSIPMVRNERKYPISDRSVIWCDSFEDAIDKLKEYQISNLLALTGVQTINKLKQYWTLHPSWFRILNRKESIEIALNEDFPVDRLVFYQQGEDEYLLIKQLNPDAILTKESGESGYFNEKIEAAQKAGIHIFAIKRPTLPEDFILVYGEIGLRKEIEKILPTFFTLRCGFTTGACATAAAKAALQALITGEEQWISTFTLPNGEDITLPTSLVSTSQNSASYCVIKNAGDDPDVTNGCSIIATVTLREGEGITFLRGEGVGIVTLPGLGLEIGGPAINATPRKMMIEQLGTLYNKGIDITISVPHGAEIAQRTFNPKLGIIDGISIIGTSGIVRPFSSEAFIQSIEKEVNVAKAIGCSMLVINSGAKSERYIKKRYNELPAQAFIHYGNFIGETLLIAKKLQFEQVTMGIMLGKAVKLAEGYMDTHSKKVTMNKVFLQEVADLSGCSLEAKEIINSITLARELWNLLSPTDQKNFFTKLLELCKQHCAQLFPQERLTIMLINEEGHIPYIK